MSNFTLVVISLSYNVFFLILKKDGSKDNFLKIILKNNLYKTQ